MDTPVGTGVRSGGASQVTSFPFTFPAGAELVSGGRTVQAGDLAIIFLRAVSGAATITGPTGATSLFNVDGGNSRVGVWWKYLDSTDITAGSLTVTRSASSTWAGEIVVYPSTTSVDQVSALGASLTISTTAVIPAVTPGAGASDAIRLGFIASRTDATATSTTYTAPAGWTEDGDISDTHATARRGTAWLGQIALSGQGGVAQPTVNVTASGAGMTYGAVSLTLVSAGDTRPAPDTAAVAVPGDSLVRENGLGSTDIPAELVPYGWSSAKVFVDGQTGRTIVDGAVTPTTQTTIDTWRAVPQEALTWLIELGANNQAASVASNMADYRTLLEKIGPGRNVVFFGVGYYDQTDCAVAFDGAQPAGSKWTAVGGAGSPNAAMLNIVDQGTDPLTEPTILGYFDWNNWAPIRAVGDAAVWWKMDDVSSPSGQPRHMNQVGYQVFRNVAYALAVGLAPGYVGGAAPLFAAASFTAAGASFFRGTATAAASSAFTATGTVRVPGSSAGSAASSFTAAGTVRVPGAAAGSAVSAFTAAGAVRVPGAAAMTATSALTAAGAVNGSGTAAASAVSGFTAAGTVRVPGTAVMSAASAFTAAAGNTVPGAAAVSASSAFTAAASVAVGGQAAAAAASAFTAAGTVRVAGTAPAAAASTFTAAGRVVVTAGGVAMVAVSGLSAAGGVPAAFTLGTFTGSQVPAAILAGSTAPTGGGFV